MLPERIKWMKLWNQRKVHVWRKLPNGPVISYRSGWRGGWGGVGWGKEGVLSEGLYIYSYCHKNIAEPYGVSGKFYRNTSKILQTLLPPEHK